LHAAGLTCLLHHRNHVWQELTLFVGLKSAKFDVQVPGIEGVPLGHDFFLVLKGAIKIKMGNGDARLSARELLVVPKGVAHCPWLRRKGTSCLSSPLARPTTDLKKRQPRVCLRMACERFAGACCPSKATIASRLIRVEGQQRDRC
jgi:hypothetical protein